ncbi:DeoR family transcriptional regulator [Geosporobacter ferrireducens]|uniref:DeoR family transcriptional regulator n=2 Tax=Geosporobacter ferrireducens TaxID=1424294 RepID=A0A1D8GEU9_9FIRM|nr:DeoR family transcriptional regulator [Geosporobacter ferrireducens]
MSLLGEERKMIILNKLDIDGKVTVKELSKEFQVSTETIRRDLEILENEKRLKKVYGGAIKISFDGSEPPYNHRETLHIHEKRIIGKKAADIVQDNDMIVIDVGTTTLQIIHHLLHKNNLTVLINSIPALTLLLEYKQRGLFSGRIIFLGGEINAEQMTTFGSIAEKTLEAFYLDKAFIAVGGLSVKHGITSYDVQEGTLSRKLIMHAKEVIVMADHSKLGVRNFYRIVDIDAVHAVICDKEPPKEWQDDLNDKCITWITAT